MKDCNTKSMPPNEEMVKVRNFPCQYCNEKNKRIKELEGWQTRAVELLDTIKKVSAFEVRDGKMYFTDVFIDKIVQLMSDIQK